MALHDSSGAMTPGQLRAFIRGQTLMTLISNGPDGVPHAVPMGFMLDVDDSVVCVSWRKTRKVANLRADSRAALLFFDPEARGPTTQVLLTADVAIIDDTAHTLALMRVMNEAAGEGAAPITEDKLRAIAGKRLVLRFSVRETVVRTA